MNTEISPLIYEAIKIIKKSFGGTDVELISEKMFRTQPNRYYPYGNLGVYIKVDGIKTFLGCESNAEDICLYGLHIAEEFVANVYILYSLKENHEVFSFVDEFQTKK